MTKVDIKDAFYMIPIASPFPVQGGLRASSVQLSPFCLCTASRVFTKTLRPAIQLLNSLGIRLVTYIHG